MVEDGICEIEPGLFSRTIRFSDINYQTARRDDQIDIFSRYCEFLNWLSSSIHLQINLINRRIDKDSFKEQMFLKYQGERLDEYRKEINTMLSEKALEGQNSILREKYMTVTTAASSYETSIPALARLETDIVLDPEREYAPLADGFDGEVIRIGGGSKSCINPMDINMDYSDDEQPLALKSELVLTLCELLIGGKYGLSGGQRSLIGRACSICYRKYFQHPCPENIPTLRDFYEVLKKQPEPDAANIVLELEIYIEGNLSIFADHTNVDTNKRFLVYDIRDLGKQLRTFGMVVVMDQIWNRITRNRAIGRHTWLYIDEMQLLFSNEFSANYFFELWSRSRKWGAIPTGITQNVETLLLSDLARRMLSNSRFILMFNQATSDRVELANLLNISNRQLDYVTNADSGQGLLFAGKSIVPFINNVPKNTKLYQMMTTKLEEVAPSSGKSESSSPEG